MGHTGKPNPSAPTSTPAGPTPAAAGQTPADATPPLNVEAETQSLCEALDKFFRSRSQDMPSSADLAELRGLQAGCRDLVTRAAAGAASVRTELAASQQQFTAVTGERDKLKAALLQARADFLNYQQRAASDLKRAEELALRNYVQDLLPILDSLDLSLADARQPVCGVEDQAAQEAGAEAAANDDRQERITHALELIAQSLHQALKVRGLERIVAAGKPFDPQIHEAVCTSLADPSQGEVPNQAVEELRPGYLWKGLLLRPAQVRVTAPEPKK